MNVTEIADEVYRELGEPTDISIPVVAFWLRTNVGSLNNLINEAFSVSETDLEITNADGAISIDAASILKRLYDINYYQRQYIYNLTTMSSETLLEVKDGNRTVRKINRNEIGKTILEAKASAQNILNNLVSSYKISKSAPRQVAGDDTVQGKYHGGQTLARSIDLSRL